ncbi:mannosyl-oligosaccharide glucosidase [Spodoptera litura]|uniref:Mannosyl-oligosaccharide glucosidase n=1 Tax=Spodoptera litura TaxID=69820 RepID=A0A9J7DUJ3_SPOLT|nr:mannosyl-oligosaccharide glucosidase [Spodoptera litura]
MKMVRHRKVVSLKTDKDASSSSGCSESSIGSRTFKFLSVWKTGVGCVCFLIAVYISTLGYLETRVNTPFDDDKVSETLHQFHIFYCNQVSKINKSNKDTNIYSSSHWCDQNDNLDTYGWLRHDGVTFGEQLIVDKPHNITTSFIKTPGGEHGGHWTARINVTTKGHAKVPFVLIWYAALDESLGPAAPHSRLWYEDGSILGHTPQLHNFRINLVPQQGKLLHTSYSEANAPGLHLLKEKLYSLLKIERHSMFGKLAVLGADDELHIKEKDINFVPIQMLVETPFCVDIVYTTEDLSTPPLKGEKYARVLQEKKTEFDAEFESKFRLDEKGSFFPRGFLWDEGFHGLLIGRWSPDIQMDIAAHWMDLINVEGWIPREQILGAEALARVPKEFVVQSNAAANPPMLLIQLAHFVKIRPELFVTGSKHRATLDRMFSRLQAWYQWFQTTQKGDEPTSYRWRGREDDGLQLNPKTLTSGLDDYPRASHPSDIERHVDLRCWMYAAADAMMTIADLLQRDSSKYEATKDQLGDEELLNELHWSTHTQTYADYGLHTDGVKLVRQQPKNPSEPAKVVRSVTVPPQPRLVTSVFGYVSLFPMLMKVLKPDSDKLGKILEDLDKPELLWSPYGLRSLSKSAPLYMKRNTEHDPPYWRGQIWVPINYLALSSLKHYANAGGPHAARAAELNGRLRDNVVRNILNQYKKTGYLFEQYSAEDGKGSGCKPFNGWTALVVLIMADEY